MGKFLLLSQDLLLDARCTCTWSEMDEAGGGSGMEALLGVSPFFMMEEIHLKKMLKRKILEAYP